MIFPNQRATNLVLFTLLNYLSPVQAAWYYDKASCDVYKSLLAKAVPAAIDLAQTAHDAIGNAPGTGAPTGTLWQFPDTETRDLTGRLFGDLQGARNANKFHIVKNNLNYILQNYNTQGNNNGIAPADSATALGRGDLVFYCDTSRLKENPDGSYNNPNTAQVAETDYTAKDYKDCNTFLNTAGMTATADDPNAPVAIQLCSWFMNRINSRWKKNEVIADYIPHLYDKKTSLKEWLISKLPKLSWTEVELYNLLDHTILHEMTHTIPTSPNNNPQTAQRATDDQIGYYWKNVYAGRTNLRAQYNADTYAYLGLGAKFLKDASGRINKNGEVEKITNYVWPGTTPANPENVDASWTLTATKRDTIGHADWEEIQPKQFYTVIRTERDQSNKPWYPIYPRQIESSLGTGTIGTSSGTGVSGISSTIGPLTNTSTPAQPSNSGSSTATDVASVSSVEFSSTSTVEISTATTETFNANTSTVSASLTNSSIQVNSTTIPTGSTLASITTLLSNSDATPTSSGSNSDGITSTDTSSSPPPTSTLPSVTLTTSSSIDLAALLSSFWAQTPTAAPTGSWLFCDALDINCPVGTLSLESLVTHTEIYIPPIEDGIFPTIKVKHPEHEDDDGVPEIPFVKIDLPKDKCDPLPKPKPNGLLGAVVNVASKALDTVLDAACHLEVPVVKGKLPKWLKFPSFPPLDDFPPVGEPPKETQQPDPTQDPTGSASASESSASSSSPSSSSSSSCSASAIPACTTTFFMDGSSTQSLTTSCTTISACSQTAENSATAVTCSATGVPHCVGTNIISGTVTQSYATSCSTITACSGTGATSATDITQAPAETHWPLPLPEPNWVDEVGCALSVLQSDATDFDAAMDACFSVTGSPNTTESASLTSVAPETSLTNSDLSTTTSVQDTSSTLAPTNTTSLDSSILPPSATSSSPDSTSQVITDVSSSDSTPSISPTTDAPESSSPSTTIAESSAECLSIRGGQGGCVTPNPTITPLPPPPPPRESCLNREWAAPATMDTTDGSTNARDAIEQFCKNHDGTTIQKGSDSDPTYDRWDVSGFGVTKRGSMWIRASAGPFDQCGEGKITYADCKLTLEQGLGSCTDPNNGLTNGFVGQGNECTEYSLDISDSVHDGDPPWNQHVVAYPPNEHEMVIDNPDRGPWQVTIGCGGDGPGYTSDDVDNIINTLCNNWSGKPFPGIAEGDWFNSGGPDQEPGSGHIWMKAGFANDKWQDPGWCDGHQDALNTDDCAYAVRKMTSQCGGGFHSANWYYRCSDYLVCIATSFDDAKKCIQYE